MNYQGNWKKRQIILRKYVISKVIVEKCQTIFKEDAYTDLNESPEVLERKTRAFSPWPILWSTLDSVSSYIGSELKDKSKKDLKVKIYEGSIVNDKFSMDVIQVEGKNKMNWKEFKNGYII